MNHRATITLTTKRNFVLDAFEGDAITQEIQASGEYDTNTLNSLVDILTKIQPTISLDVGANIGNHSVLMAQLSKHVIAFEPVSFIYEVLKKNLAQNQRLNVTAHNLGLSNQVVSRTIHILNNGNLGSSSIEVTDNVAETQQISTVDADTFLHTTQVNQAIDFIKIDVEGHEVPAILGMQNIIRVHQPLLLIEWRNQQMIDDFVAHQLLERVFAGYACYALSATTHKKAYAKGMTGFFSRMYHKLIGKTWCFTSFDPKQNYSNIYLIPKRYAYLVNDFKYLTLE